MTRATRHTTRRLHHVSQSYHKSCRAAGIKRGSISSLRWVLSCFDRFLRRSNGDVQTASRAAHHPPRTAPAGACRCHRQSDGGLDRPPDLRGLSLGHGAQIPYLRWRLWGSVQATGQRHGHQGSPYGTTLALAKRLCRTADRINPTRMFGSSDHYRGGTSAPRASRLRRLLQSYPHSPVFKQRYAIGAANSAGRPDQIHTSPWRSAPFIRPGVVCGRDTRAAPGTASWSRQDRCLPAGRWTSSSLRTSRGLIRDAVRTRLCLTRSALIAHAGHPRCPDTPSHA